MRFNKSIFLLSLLCIKIHCAKAQNNAIFLGGSGSGTDAFCYLQADAVLNNSIFLGGLASGADAFCYLQADAVLNNSIFLGGLASGADAFCYLQANAVLNNSIFLGGLASGADAFCYLQANAVLNNSIFLGGLASGNVVSCLGTLTEVPLPVTLLYFEAITKNRKVYLKWITATEINNDFFTIERSRDGLQWEKILIVDGAGVSSKQLTYNSIDQTPYSGASYYHVKQTDFDGNFLYSSIRAVNIDSNSVKIFPNPTKDKFYISTSSDSEYSVSLIDAYGRTITNTNNSKEVSVENLPDGMYIIQIRFIGEETTNLKVIVNKQ